MDAETGWPLGSCKLLGLISVGVDSFDTKIWAFFLRSQKTKTMMLIAENPPTMPPITAPLPLAKGEHSKMSMTEPPQVLQASNTSEPPKTPLQSTTNSAAAIASVAAVTLQAHVREWLEDEYATVAQERDQRVPS